MPELAELKEDLEEAKKASRKAVHVARAARAVVWEHIWEHRLEGGEIVIADFSGGKERCIYVGRDKDYNGVPVVVLRHFTKRGKPCKGVVAYPYTIAETLKTELSEPEQAETNAGGR